jgi:polysaccharide biosynthesis protein PslG
MRARRRAALLAAFAAALALGGGLAATARSAAPAGFVGMVSQDTFAGSSRYRATQLHAMRAAGVTVLREVLDWSVIERRRGVFNFSSYDSAILAAAREGIEIMPILYDEPSYLSAGPRHSHLKGTYPPASPDSIAAFATAAVRWYGPGGAFWKRHRSVTPVPIRIWQIWNEPNLSLYWLPKPSPSQYVAMLAAASAAIRSVDPGAQVVSAGIPQSPLGTPLLTYLRGMLAAGAAKWMNTLGVNAYAHTPDGVIALLRSVRAVLDGGGGRHVAMRVTEFGWSDAGPGSDFKLTPTGQAAAIGTVLRDFYEDRGPLGLIGFDYFDWRDARPYRGTHDFWGLHTGLLRLNGTAKPALKAFTDAALSM